MPDVVKHLYNKANASLNAHIIPTKPADYLLSLNHDYNISRGLYPFVSHDGDLQLYYVIHICNYTILSLYFCISN